MAHYAENFATAASFCTPSALALFGGASNSSHDEGLRVICIKRPKGPSEKYNPFFYRRKAEELFDRVRPKVVHIVSYSVGLKAFSERLSSLGAKVIYTVHDPEPHEENITLWGKIFGIYRDRLQLRWVFRKVDGIHVHSEKHRDTLGSLYGEGIKRKTYIVQHGAGITEGIRNGSQVPPELAGPYFAGRLVLLFFGRIHPYKGIADLIEAFRILRDDGLPVTLIIAGQGVVPESISQNDKAIILINRFIRDDEIRSIFEMADIVVLPYVSATQSGVVPLAYAFSKAVVCTDVGALPEIVVNDRTGLIVPSKHPKALAEAILSLNDRERLTRMGCEGKHFIEKEIGWRRIAERHLVQYGKMLNSVCTKPFFVVDDSPTWRHSR